MERLIASPARGTKDRILDAAEALFAERGFGETSLRDITSAAGVNLAAVNYHFQSKDALIQAVFARRLGPLNEARLKLLDQVEAAAGKGRLPLEQVLRAFLEPLLRFEHAGFKRLFGRMYADPGDLFEKIFRRQFAEAKVRFMAAFRRALPDLDQVEFLWRFHFMIGAMAHTLSGLHHLEVISDGRCDPSDRDAMLARLIAFIAAGFRAPGGGKCVR